MVQGVVVAALVGFAIASPFFFEQIGAAAGDETSKAPTGSYRATQDVELDLQVDFGALYYESSVLMADNRPTGLTPGWDRHTRIDWSRRVGKSWELDPV